MSYRRYIQAYDLSNLYHMSTHRSAYWSGSKRNSADLVNSIQLPTGVEFGSSFVGPEGLSVARREAEGNSSPRGSNKTTVELNPSR